MIYTKMMLLNTVINIDKKMKVHEGLKLANIMH